VSARLADVRHRIEVAARAAGRSPGEIRLMAVSKRQSQEKLEAAYVAGQRDFGENYVQALLERKAQLPDDARFHLIGPVQSNKAKKASEAASVHTVDSVRIAERLDASASELKRTLPVFLQVNISNEPTKSGFAPEQLESVLQELLPLRSIELRGLMCIPDQERPEAGFRALRVLRDQLEIRLSVPLPELSMGMSDDFELAIREGATWIRVGTGIFGARQG
jgi:PLP dependent protein